MLFYIANLLASIDLVSQSDRTSYDLLPLNVTLGRVEDQLAQIDALARHLWKHVDVLGSRKLSIRSVKNYFSYFFPLICLCRFLGTNISMICVQA